VKALPGISDESLMVRAGTGDLAAFEELVIRSQSAAWALAYHYSADPVEAEDIVQEAFLKLLKSAPRYQPTAGFRTYFSRIVVRLCLDYRSKKRPIYLESLPESIEAGNNPESLLQKKETASEINRALLNLPPNQRMAFVLRYIEEMNYSQISETMGISLKAVDSLLQRGRQALRSRFNLSQK
jgi:RNA polymerase sigma-70 factor, ECF subfamily